MTFCVKAPSLTTPYFPIIAASAWRMSAISILNLLSDICWASCPSPS